MKFDKFTDVCMTGALRHKPGLSLVYFKSFFSRGEVTRERRGVKLRSSKSANCSHVINNATKSNFCSNYRVSRNC